MYFIVVVMLLVWCMQCKYFDGRKEIDGHGGGGNVKLFVQRKATKVRRFVIWLGRPDGNLCTYGSIRTLRYDIVRQRRKTKKARQMGETKGLISVGCIIDMHNIHPDVIGQNKVVKVAFLTQKWKSTKVQIFKLRA